MDVDGQHRNQENKLLSEQTDCRVQIKYQFILAILSATSNYHNLYFQEKVDVKDLLSLVHNMTVRLIFRFWGKRNNLFTRQFKS